MKYTLLGTSLLLCSCATTPTVESITTEGGNVVEGGIGSMIGADGASLNAVDGTWAVYFSPEGEKIVYIKSRDDKQTLSWRRKDDGTFCEIMTATKKERCEDGSVVTVRNNAGVHYTFTNGKVGKYPYTVAEGNPNNL